MAGLTFSMLTLGTRGDAKTWITGCESLGMTRLPGLVREARPRLPAVKTFLASSPHWMFFGGHFDNSGLYNDRELEGNDDEAVLCKFEEKQVRARSHRVRAILKKGTSGLGIDANCRVTYWGGCNVASDTDKVQMLMRLFGAHLLIGFSDTTSPRLMSAVIGTRKDEGDFFAKLKAKKDPTDATAVREAWFEAMLASKAAKQAYLRYAVFDATGQEWVLRKNRRVRGRPLEMTKGRKVSI